MKIVILGAGKVGESLAESLVSENNDITLIDVNAERLRLLQDRLDLRVVVGSGITPSVLAQAGIEDADIFIASAQLDETNLVASKLASALFNVPKVIARLRSPEYRDIGALLGKGGFGVDHLICPEQSVMETIARLVEFPQALRVIEFAGGAVSLIAVRACVGSPLLLHTLGELPSAVAGKPMKVVAVFRREQNLALQEATGRIEPGDEVFVMAATDDIRAVLSALFGEEPPVRRLMIAGGGNIGLRLARHFEHSHYVKIIEWTRSRCEYLASQTLSDTLVLNGDATDEDLLSDENVGEMCLFLALTNDDENNIMAALLAKRIGARRTLALINRRAYGDLMQGSQIDITLVPAQSVIGEMLRHVRRGDVVAVHSLRRGAAEAIEAIAHGDHKTSKVVGRRVTELSLPKGAQLGAIVRAGAVIFPDGDCLVQADDHLIFFVANKRHVRDFDRLFAVSATFF
jgi:trk system potassium uptake protein